MIGALAAAEAGGSSAPRGVEHVVRAGLRSAAHRARSLEIPIPPLEGKLLRPLLAVAMVPRESRAGLDGRFWMGALAIQMAHEASILHDDVLDAASIRRGEPSFAAKHGIGPALVLGDHYLTGAYRVAAATGSFEFVSRFADAVERTVAGEIAQGNTTGRALSEEDYDGHITGKSGELFGAAAVLGAIVLSLGDTEARAEIGRAFGNLYQRIDDLLDYCTLPGETGKQPLKDYHQGKWSSVLGLAGVSDFSPSDEAVVAAIFRRRARSPSAARMALESIREQGRRIDHGARVIGASSCLLDALLRKCLSAAERGVTGQELALGPTLPPTAGTACPESGANPPASGTIRLTEVPAPGFEGAESPAVARPESDIVEAALALGGPDDWNRYFGEHGRTFRLASRLFPPREAGLVCRLYAYCRFTDDLVDRPADDPTFQALRARLTLWRELSLSAFDGTPTGIPLLDGVLTEASRRGVARHYVEALLDGMEMDLEPRVYRSWVELERYTFGVAGAVGGWMSQLLGVRDPELLERAHALGHAMQTTNIVRDVGEDLERGRVYLPDELLHSHGLSRDGLVEIASAPDPIPEAYRALIEEVIARADGYYATAWPGIRALPDFFRRPVAAAAGAYRGIHREIRRNGYDNLTRRAYTSGLRKLVLAGSGLLGSRMPS